MKSTQHKLRAVPSFWRIASAISAFSAQLWGLSISFFFRFFYEQSLLFSEVRCACQIKISNVSAQRGILRPQHQLSFFDLRERLRCKLKESLLALYTHQKLSVSSNAKATRSDSKIHGLFPLDIAKKHKKIDQTSITSPYKTMAEVKWDENEPMREYSGHVNINL